MRDFLRTTKHKYGLLITGALVCCILSACAPGEPAPQRPFVTEDLLLTQEDVPAHWYLARIAPLGPSIGFGDEEDDRRVLFTRPGDEKQIVFSSHMVLRFESQRKAENWFKREYPSWFNDRSIAVEGQYKTPTELSYRSSTAEQFHVACNVSTINNKQSCTLMAQYEEFVTIFFSSIAVDTSTLPEFNNLVGRIDEIMVAHLQAG